MPDLPPVYQPKKSSFTRFIYSLITLFIMLAALPIGVYLVQNQTNFQQKAADNVVSSAEVASFALENTQGAESVEEGVIPIDVVVQSPKDDTNLFVAKLSFPPDLIEVQKVATSAATLEEKSRFITDKLIDASFNNQEGIISLIAGVPNPGLKTDQNKKYILATIYIKAKSSEDAVLSLTGDSTMYKNSDNSKLEVKADPLSLKFDTEPQIPNPTPSCQPRPVCLSSKPPCRIPEPLGGWCPTPSKNGPTLDLIAPQGGEVYSYTSTIPVRLKGTGVKDISVILLMNGNILGKIATVSSTTTSFNFKPADFISPTFVTDSNTFSLEINAVSNTGENLSDKTDGPFGIVAKKDVVISASQSANLAQRGGDANKDGRIDFTDLSIFFSHYNSDKTLSIETDLNGDGVVNDVDLYFMRGLLISSSAINE